MDDEIRDCIAVGLHSDNLDTLIALCAGGFEDFPAVYGSIILIANILLREFDGQGMETSRLTAIEDLLQEPLLDLVDARGEEEALVYRRLESVHLAFHRIP